MAGIELIGKIDEAIEEIRLGGSSSAAVQLLVESNSDVEPALFGILSDRQVDSAVVALIARVLVERDVNRDPEFLVELIPNMQRSAAGSGTFMRVLGGDVPYPPPGAHVMGFARLRRLDPVKVYSEQLKHSFFGVRLTAAAALGDTADLTALDPLTRALNDSNWRVRANAADSVRRLRHAGAATVLHEHPVRDRLIERLTDRRRAVRVAAARALGSMADDQPIQQARGRLSRWSRKRRDLDRVLSCEVPPLPQLWPGDRTI